MDEGITRFQSAQILIGVSHYHWLALSLTYFNTTLSVEDVRSEHVSLAEVHVKGRGGLHRGLI
jgi:hypothetical protein